MRKIFIFLFLFFLPLKVFASVKSNIIENIKNINNLSFNFEQNINGKIENGVCTVEYPKKIYCKYDLDNKKILVSNGTTLVIKTTTSYYLYPLEKTPLNLILDKNFLIDKLDNLNERIIDNKYINFTFIDNDNEINVFFDSSTYNLIGWQTLDIYQNLSITYLNTITKNIKIDKNLFKIPNRN